MTDHRDSAAGFAAAREVTIVETAVDVLDRAERQASLTATELSDLRRALEQVRENTVGTTPEAARFDADRLRAFVTVTSGAASGAAVGAVAGTLLGAVTGSLLFPGMGTIAGAAIGAGFGMERRKAQ